MGRSGVVRRGAEADRRLCELGVPAVILRGALRAGDRQAHACRWSDPPHLAGIVRHARTVRLLREQLVPHGWSYDNRLGQARTISPDGQFAIIAMAGDPATGIADLVPTNQHPKGLATALAVAPYGEQEPLDAGWADSLFPVAESDRLTTWVLLYYVAPHHEVRAELSLPRSFDGQFHAWRERILLRPLAPAADVAPVTQVTEQRAAWPSRQQAYLL